MKNQFFIFVSFLFFHFFQFFFFLVEYNDQSVAAIDCIKYLQSQPRSLQDMHFTRQQFQRNVTKRSRNPITIHAMR